MKIYQLRQTQVLPITIQQAWDFFSNPANLGEITPKHMKFRILSNSGSESMYPGQSIRYRIRILPAIWVNWLTEITQVSSHQYFVDEQRKGPYAFWQHKHHFKEVPGGVEITDELRYAIPLGWLGTLVQRFFVGQELETIFAHRRAVLENKFKTEKKGRILSGSI